MFSTVWDADTHATQSLFYAQRCQHWRHNEGGMTSDTASKRQDELLEKERGSEEDAPEMEGARFGAQEVGGPPEGLRVRTLPRKTRGVHAIAPDAHVGAQHEARRSDN